MPSYKYGNERYSEAVLSAQNTFCAPFCPVKAMNMSIQIPASGGAWSGTLTLQKSYNYFKYLNNPGQGFDGPTVAAASATWQDTTMSVASGTVVESTNIIESEQYTYYRLGFKTGNYTSGSVYVRLGSTNFWY